MATKMSHIHMFYFHKAYQCNQEFLKSELDTIPLGPLVPLLITPHN
jgi:hypothetical protein